MNEEHKIPEKIARAGKKLPFGVPERYFDEFRGRLQERIQREGPAKAEKGLIRMVRPAMGYAALVAAFLIIAFFAFRQMSPTGRQDLSDADLSEIVDYFLVDYDEELLYQTISDLHDSLEITPLSDQSDEILEYLAVDGVDYALLIDENQ